MNAGVFMMEEGSFEEFIYKELYQSNTNSDQNIEEHTYSIDNYSISQIFLEREN